MENVASSTSDQPPGTLFLPTSQHYWHQYIQKTTQECTFWSCLPLTTVWRSWMCCSMAPYSFHVDWLIDWLVHWFIDRLSAGAFSYNRLYIGCSCSSYISVSLPCPHLQCFGWAAGRASGLLKLSGRVLAWLSARSVVQMICMWSSWCHCHPSSLHC